MSAKDSLITLPDPLLRKRSSRVNLVDDTVKAVIEQMKASTLDWEASRPHEVGVALAAIQIGKPVKIVIVRNNFEDKKDQSFSVFINPEIVKYEGGMEEDFEGCLSVKDVYGKVPRYTSVRVRALNEEGGEVRVRAEGFLARVFQHEIDHTKGIMFVDHIADRPDHFYKLTSEGQLEKIDYDKISEAGLLRD